MGGRLETFFIAGPAGRIECMFKRPSGPPAAGAAIVCHPHPLFGGTMHNKVVHAAAEAIAGAGIPVLRFNFRGVGGSGGAHDGGRGERRDLLAVMDHLSGLYPGRPQLLAGYSFGSHVALAVGALDPRAAALIGIGLPVGLASFDFLQRSDRPLTIIQGERDTFGPLAQILAFASRLPGGVRVVAVPGAGHNFAGHLDELGRRVLEAIPEGLREVAASGGRPPGMVS